MMVAVARTAVAKEVMVWMAMASAVVVAKVAAKSAKASVGVMWVTVAGVVWVVVACVAVTVVEAKLTGASVVVVGVLVARLVAVAVARVAVARWSMRYRLDLMRSRFAAKVAGKS